MNALCSFLTYVKQEVICPMQMTLNEEFWNMVTNSLVTSPALI